MRDMESYSHLLERRQVRYRATRFTLPDICRKIAMARHGSDHIDVTSTCLEPYRCHIDLAGGRPDAPPAAPGHAIWADISFHELPSPY
jgi:hypothetical protein